MRNLQVQTIFFSATSTQTVFFFRQRFCKQFFFYEMHCFIMRSFLLLHYSLVLHLLNNISGPVFLFPSFSAVVQEFFCCLRISAFNLSSTCLLASLITLSLRSKSSPVNCSIKDSSAPSTLSIVLLLSTGVTLTLPSSQATLSRESSGFPQHSSSLLS